MLTANEAKKIALNEEKKISKQFEEVENYIGEAAFNGNFSVSVVGELHPYIRKHLETIGYKVSFGNQYNDSYYTISWHEII